MAKDRSLVRASDIGTWTYCHRAWWLAQVKGIPHRRPESLEAGELAHTAHGQQVRRSQHLRTAGLILVAMAALILAAGWLILWGG
ncbi:hypothetical protein FKZ61_013525 [Litorilinea aerophila]|uniref:DUF83 domain-containing protein n=1 Tax=Litorilinea aerophila TaxID=1204385 RepID=A0A540VEH0_9CHLR|nr:hypothetical protein [Litorilinea aerophila]MCC9077123.1 hypothetical protein [Litorilinea aerophila]OUC09645.1 hypothetical protein RY27_01580 [Litorilinea aerophila]GIV76133.1 MAG: hypothetical protein KatS3mg050_0527 [Litorilinea sp.]